MTLRQAAFEAIGTKWNIRAKGTHSDETWDNVLKDIRTRIDQFDGTYSRFRADSIITAMSKKSGTYPMPADAHKLLDFYQKLYDVSNGLVTPLIGQVMADAGYDATYSFREKPLTSPPAWQDTISHDKQNLILRKPVLLDFGAAGKGYLVDIISELLSAAGIREYVIDAGGDILQRSKSKQPNVIGLENPFDSTEVIGEVTLANQSLCASSGSRRQWGKYHHIINPAALESPTNIAATWVIANDTMQADGLATALFFVSAETLAKHFSFSYAVLKDDMSVEYAPHFPVKLYKATA